MKIASLILVSAIILMLAWAQPASAETGADCTPGRRLGPPAYPPELAKRKISGSVVLDLTIDACGRVLAAAVKHADTHEAFNEAALESVDGVTLMPAQRAGVVNGRVALPIDFHMNTKTLTYQKIDWPATHKHPRYVIDHLPMVYATADEASKAIKAQPDYFWPSPYPVQSRFVQVGEPGRREFWLFVFKDGTANLAAHYRPVLEEGEPVVQLSVRCNDTAEACDKAQESLLKGLPFAKAK
jgi:TonB family protein